MSRASIARIAGLMTALSVLAIACSSESDPIVTPVADRATAIVAATATEPTTRPSSPRDGSPTPVAFRPEITVDVPAVGPTETESGLTVSEVLRRSKEHADSATSVRVSSGPILPGIPAPDPASGPFTEYVRPDLMRSVNSDGSVEVITVNGATYRQSTNGDGKWWHMGPAPTLDLFPTRIIPFDLAGAGFADLDDPDFFFIEGYASPLTRADATIGPGADVLMLHRLKIRKSDFVFISLANWSLPLSIRDDEKLDRSALLLRQAEIKAGRLDFRAEYFDYNVEIDIQPPDESFAGVFLAEPRDNRLAPVASEISYTITRPVKIMEISISPPAELVMEREEPVNTLGLRRIYKPVERLEYETDYVVTLNWGDSEEDMQSISWAFTTATRLGLRSR